MSTGGEDREDKTERKGEFIKDEWQEVINKTDVEKDECLTSQIIHFHIYIIILEPYIDTNGIKIHKYLLIT